MAGIRYSVRAERDITMIAEYTLNQWGEEQAFRYLDSLEACCQLLEASPSIGRLCDHIRPGLRRIEHGKHVVFFREDTEGILVLRILHHSVLPGRQPMEDGEV